MDHSLKVFEGKFKALDFKRIMKKGQESHFIQSLEEIIINWLESYFIPVVGLLHQN